MKKILTIALLALIATGASAQEEKKKDNKPVFTVVKELPITSIKDQNRSGTCWDYSTLSYFEAEILRKTGKTYDLCEAFVANKTYMDRAIQVVRLHGDCQFAQGGAAYDVYYVLKNYGICPEDAMPAPGSMQGDSLFNFNEFFSIMSPYVDAACRAFWMPIWASAPRPSPMKARPIPHRAMPPAWDWTGTTTSALPATHTTPSTRPSPWRYRTTGVTR